MILDDKARKFSTLVTLPVNPVGLPSAAVGALCLYDSVTLEPVIWAAAGALVFGGSITFSGSTISGGVIDAGFTATGSAANDFSGSTGTFKTSTGAATFGGSSNTFSGGPIIDSSAQALSGVGAMDVTHSVTKLTTTGSAQALSLANGVDGQIKKIIHDVDGGSAVLTPTTKSGFSTLTFTNVGDTAVLQYTTTRGWVVLSLNGTTLA